jgi:hypothetical protein
MANDLLHRAVGHFLGHILVTSAVNTDRPIEHVLTLI